VKRLIDYFADNSLIVNLVSVVIVVAGLMSAFTLQKENFPNVDFDFILIRTVYPGASAEDTEKLVTIEIERKLKEVEGIDDLNGMSGEGFSIITLEVDPDYDVDSVLIDVRNAVDNVTELPDDVDPPTINKLNNKQRPILKYALSSDKVDEWRLRKVTKDLRDYLERKKGIAAINLEGYREEIVDVAVDLNKLERYELTLQEISQAISDRNINISAGNIETGTEEIQVRTLKEFENIEDIKSIVVRSNASGLQVQIQDIAKVTKSLDDAETIDKAWGKPVIFLQVVAKESADILDTTDMVKEEIDRFFELNNITKIEKEVSFDFSFYVKRRLNILVENGLIGVALVFICLLLFMSFRISVVTSIGAPLAFFTAFALMDSVGMTVNLISMFGMILVLGMLIDDSIIVAENFYQYVEKGMDPKEAAKKAAWETLAPVTATILTTMVAFGSLFFMGGIMGKFLWPVPAVVIICLLASWLECFFILPSHLSDFVKVKPGEMEKTRWYQPLYVVYEKSLRFGLKYNKTTIVTFVLLFFASLGLLKTMRFELFPSDDVTRVFVNIKGPVGYPLEKTAMALDKVTKIAQEVVLKEEVEFISSKAGSQQGRTGFTRTGSHYGMVQIELTMQSDRQRTTSEILDIVTDRARRALPNFEISTERKQQGPPRGKPVNIEISGDSLDKLQQLADIAAKQLKSIEGVLGIDVDFEEGKRQLIVAINEGEARRLGLTNVQIAMEVRRAFEGAIATEIRRTDEDVEVIVRLNEEGRSKENSLDNLYILNNQGRRIALSRVAKIVPDRGAFVIRRFQRKRTISVTADVDSKKTSSLEVNKKIKPFMNQLMEKNPLFSYELAGENKDTSESVQRLGKAFVISMGLIFIILVSMFSSLVQPAIIMAAIPLGLIGVILVFKLFGMSFGFMAMMGVIGLVGVVVNDSIVLVTFLNKHLNEYKDRFEAVVKGTISRFRPVILTTFTTVAGLLPIAHDPDGDPFLKPMATSFAYGLLFSTTLTLMFVPNCYFLYVKVIDWWEARKVSKNKPLEAE
jgi:multidrug efflux pump subunit AcrB